MNRISNHTYSRIFLFGALFNLSFAIPGLLLPRFVATLAYGPDMVASVFSNYHSYSFYNIVWGAILIFGIGYYFVFRDVSKNRGIVWMAIIGKSVFFIFFTYSYFTDRASLLALLGGTCDLIFTLIFLLFLWQTKDDSL